MSPEIIFDPYTKLYSEASGLMRSSAVRDLMSVIGRSDVISFGGGLPFIGGLPPEDISGVMDKVLSKGMAEAFQYGETEGRERLKNALLGVMGEEGIHANPEHILITTGSQQALDLVGRIFLNHDDPIVLEGPTYLGALSAFLPNGPRILTIPLDNNGIRLDDLERQLEQWKGPDPKFIYVVPSFHNPAGLTMSLDRRRGLLEIARARNILVVEDNPYGLLRFEGEAVPPLAAMDPGNVVYLGTLSKIVSPGIRTGWALGPAPIIERLSTLKQSADLCSSALNQMFAEEYIESGLWLKNVENLKPIYRSRRDAMLQALEENFPEGSSWTRPEGGLFIWVTLPEFLDAQKMLPLAINQKVAYVPGTAFYADGSGANNMRLNFSYADEDLIAEGITRLGKVIRKEIELYHSLGLDAG
ncbi:MAG: aminotransferase-like domain-containing protein [Candidatus Geothermincolia bacterium]